MDNKMLVDTILEIMYIVCGIVLIIGGIYSYTDKKNPKRIGSAVFWILFGIIFLAGPYMNKTVVGGILVFMGILTVTKNVKPGSLENSSVEKREEKAEELGNRLFIPALSIGVVAFGVAQFTKMGGLVGLGIGSLVAIILTMAVTKEHPKYVPYDSSRILHQMGPTVILPQLLGALGLTAGYCGTLMTPMAANFNVVPASLLEMKNKNGVILAQFPVAIIMLVLHIIVMYFFAF